MNLSYLRFMGLGRAKRFVGRSDSGWDYLTLCSRYSYFKVEEPMYGKYGLSFFPLEEPQPRQIYHATFY